MSKLTLLFKGKVLKVFSIIEGSMTLGSDPSCDIFIDSLALEAKHSQIDTDKNKSSIKDLDSENGTYLNQAKIESLEPLKNGDVIQIGKHTLSYLFIDDNPTITNKAKQEETSVEIETQEKNQGWLQIMNGSNLGQTMSLNKSMTNIGKAGVSTAVITKRQDGYFISQLEGEHPLLIKEQALGEKSLQLVDGDTIQIGNIKMQFYLE